MCDSWAGGNVQGCYPPKGHSVSQKIGLGGVQPLHQYTQDHLLKVSVRARGDLKGRKQSDVSPVQISSGLKVELISVRKVPRGFRNQVCPWPALQSTPGNSVNLVRKMHFPEEVLSPTSSTPADFPQSWKEYDFVRSSPCPRHHGFVYLHLLHWNLFFLLSFLLWFFPPWDVQYKYWLKPIHPLLA